MVFHPNQNKHSVNFALCFNFCISIHSCNTTQDENSLYELNGRKYFYSLMKFFFPINYVLGRHEIQNCFKFNNLDDQNLLVGLRQSLPPLGPNKSKFRCRLRWIQLVLRWIQLVLQMVLRPLLIFHTFNDSYAPVWGLMIWNFFQVNDENMARLTFTIDFFSIMWQQSSSDQLDNRLWYW